MPSWSAGSRITASGLNTMLPKQAFKLATTSLTSTTTLTADPDLVLSIGSGELGSYEIDGFLSVTGAAVGTGDVKIALSYTGTMGANGWVAQGSDTSSITNLHGFGRSIDGTTQAFGVNGANFTVVDLGGSIQALTAGVLTLSWAQNTSSATATNMRLGSWLRLTRAD